MSSHRVCDGMKKGVFAHATLMILGEMALLASSALILIGLARGITGRLGVNDFAASFLIFVIILLNVRGGVTLTQGFTLSLGGVLSVIVCLYMVIARSEKTSDFLFATLSMLGNAGIVFVYTLHFLRATSIDPMALSALLSVLAGLWCAFAARRTFASCLFAAVTGGFLGTTIYLIFFQKSGNIGGSYAFATMWLSAIFGLTIQYLLSIMMRATKSPRTDSYFEAGELMEKEDEDEAENVNRRDR